MALANQIPPVHAFTEGEVVEIKKGVPKYPFPIQNPNPN
jgi:hypothetical protein